MNWTYRNERLVFGDWIAIVWQTGRESWAWSAIDRSTDRSGSGNGEPSEDAARIEADRWMQCSRQ